MLIDFPGFNLRLARMLKKRNPKIKIIYLSPPQMWMWGGWRINTLRKNVDDVLVLYPFEVLWYKSRGVKARFIGSPHYERLAPFINSSEKKESKIALLPGSRSHELKEMFPLMLDLVKRFHTIHPEVKVVIPLARTFDRNEIEGYLRPAGMLGDERIILVKSEHEKLRELSTCCFALAKPGTGTLELALLGVPSIILFKTSWLTYTIARPFVNGEYMGLPNILLGKPVCQEFIQAECKLTPIYTAMTELYAHYQNQDKAYERTLGDLKKIRMMLAR